MNQALKEDLQSLICEGNVAKLPKEQLNDYNTLKKALTKANGKYKRNTFEFPYPAQAIINRLASGEVIDFKKEFQFFATPPEMSQTMYDQQIGLPEVFKFLEPSAGHGVNIDTLLRHRPNADVTAYELSDLNFEILKEKYKNHKNVKLIKGDFLQNNFKDGLFDFILANPPFTKNQDIDHVNEMYRVLASGGRMVSIMSTSWTFGNQKKQTNFREWVEEEATIYKNGQGSFKSSGTMVNSVMVVIDK